MPIEFDCGRCQSRLRTPDDSAGKGARCPNCGSIETIPSSSLPNETVSQSNSSDFNADQLPQNAIFPELGNRKQVSSNPYAGPSPVPSGQSSPYGMGYKQLTLRSARQKLMAPAIVLIVWSSISLVCGSIVLVGMILDGPGNQMNGDAIGGAIVLGFFLLLTGLTLIGSISMLRMKGYVLSFVGAITAILMGLGCCLLPTGFGVWALVILVDPDVKRFFR